MGGKDIAWNAGVGVEDTPPFATLKPGEVRDDQVAITSACDLSQPGKYRIQVSRLDPNDPQHRPVTSNKITVKVKP